MISKLQKFKFSKSKIFSLSTLGALTIAISLWVYTSLNDEYSTRVDIPLLIQLPENRSPEKTLPSNITIVAKGSGWHLFNLIFFNQNKVCQVDLTNELINQQEYFILENTLEKSLRNIVNVTAEDVYPDNISITTGPSVEKRVPIKSRLNIIPDENFVLATETDFTPDTVTVIGNTKVLRDLNYWPTERIDFEDINKPVISVVNLKDSLSTIVELSTRSTVAAIEIQQLAEITIRDIGIDIRNNNLKGNEVLSAEKIDLTIRGGVEELADLKLSEIKAYIDLENTQAGNNVQPVVEIPEKFNLIEIQPRYIYRYTYKSRLKDLN